MASPSSSPSSPPSPSVTPAGISRILMNPSPASPCDIIVQVVGLKAVGNSTTRYTFTASDGKEKIKSMLPTSLAREVQSGNLQDLCLIQIQDYTCNEVGQSQRVLIVINCEVVAPSLGYEVGFDKESAKDAIPVSDAVTTELKPVKLENSDLKPVKLENSGKLAHNVIKSASQIIQEQHGNAAPAARMAISRRVHPLVSLNPYQGNWTIKVRVTGKGPMRTYRSARGEGNVFSVELTDEDGTQIQATMFKEAADKFHPKLELGKVYFISKGSLRVANRLYSTVKNDYEMNLNVNSEVEEAAGEATQIPELPAKIVKIQDLGPYIGGRELVDAIGVVQSVSPIMSVRRKSNNEEVPKREITIADDSQKTVAVTLWGDLASKQGAELMDMANDSPVVLIKALRVGDYQGVSLNTSPNTMLVINPTIPEARNLQSWFEKEGKSAHLTSAGLSLPGGTARTGSRSIYSEREFLSEITKPNVGEGKPAYFNVRAYITFIKPDQQMWYLACNSCNRKVTEELGSRFWCEGCQKHFDECSRRYIVVAKSSDFSGEGWFSVFNEQAEVILGLPADDLANLRSQDTDQKAFQAELKKALWKPYVMRVSVAQTEYQNEKRQRISVRSVYSVDWTGECKYLLEQIAKSKSPST